LRKEHLLQSLVEAAAVLYRSGVSMPNAASHALNQYQAHYDDFERSTLYHEICRELGGRGGRKTKSLAIRKKLPHQMSFSFSPPRKS
jgi:hypothetical protein